MYAFGVVLYELISAKNAVLKTGESVAESKGLVALVGLDTLSLTKPYLLRKYTPFTDVHVYFKAVNGMHPPEPEIKLPLTCFVLQFEEALNQSDPLEGLRKLVDPRLGENYPIDSVLKVEAFLFNNLNVIFFSYTETKVSFMWNSLSNQNQYIVHKAELFLVFFVGLGYRRCLETYLDLSHDINTYIIIQIYL